MSNTNNKQGYISLYRKAGLIYLQAPAIYERKDGGKKMKILPSPFPKYGGITKQPEYGPDAGDYYTLKNGYRVQAGSLGGSFRF